MGDPDPDRTAALRLEYEDLVRERDRLRDARRSVTSALGPLPAASAVAVGLFGLLDTDLAGGRLKLYIGVLVLFALMAVAGLLATLRKPYRKLRKESLGDDRVSVKADSEAAWLTTMIALEKGIYPDLQDGFEYERTWLLLMQGAAVLQVLLLGVITVWGSWGK